ncbi:calcium-binding protein, partial [Methylobacterium sp. V23]|uniref:calcium-binding protein n=1 Tax=Methylobacterium sp. V23 TaxID=2044878 RepID=UPI0011B0CED4
VPPDSGSLPETGKLVTGTSGNDELTGGSGHDTLDGGAGADTMIGGAGDDIYIVDHSGDVVTEMANSGTDTVRTSLTTYALKGNVENLVYTGSGGFSGVGNCLDNVLTGGAGNDVLIGGAGHDTLNGGAGHDKLNGGIGNDVLWGGAGDDTLTGDAGSDVFVFKSGERGSSFITDFQRGTDKIDLSGLGYTSFADVQAHLSTGADGFALISDAGHDILLQHVTATQLNAADFLFA